MALQMPYQPKIAASGPFIGDSGIYRFLAPTQIRLIEINSLDNRGALHCRLQYVERASPRTYTAVSYAWALEESIWYGKPHGRDLPLYMDGKLVNVREKAANILSLML